MFEGFRDKNLNDRHVYALIPIDLTKASEKYWLVEMLLLVMFPSDIKVYAEIKFQFFDNKSLHWILSSEYPMRFTGERYDDNFLHYPMSKLDEINEFINIFIDRYEKIPYLKTTVSSYISNFSEAYYRMSYLGLCISLESIVNGNSELLYKIRRNVAILCGKSEANSWILFKNIDKIYKLRSKIVHGEDYKIELIEKYLPYLINLVSRLVIEIISLNVKEKDILNDKITAIGFGDKFKISSDYKYFQFNPQVLVNIEEELL